MKKIRLDLFSCDWANHVYIQFVMIIIYFLQIFMMDEFLNEDKEGA